MPRPEIITKLLDLAIKSKTPRLSEADLINAESELGRTLFGPIPAGHQREFFHHKNNVWIWHESWLENNQAVDTTIRYEVRPHGVFKKIGDGPYVHIVGAELNNFRTATRAYLSLIKTHLYR
jgi:hypothetical protein